eukprot:9153149-Alexandrium_andersonii.AAC.1
MAKTAVSGIASASETLLPTRTWTMHKACITILVHADSAHVTQTEALCTRHALARSSPLHVP